MTQFTVLIIKYFIQYSDWLTPSDPTKVLENETPKNLVGVETKPYDNLDRMIETNDLHADLLPKYKENSPDTSILYNKNHKKLVPVVRSRMIDESQADLPSKYIEKSQDSTSIINENDMGLVPVKILETNESQVNVPAKPHTEKSQDTTMNDSDMNLVPVTSSSPIDNLDNTPEPNELQADLLGKGHIEESNDTLLKMNENDKNVPVASSGPIENLVSSELPDLLANKYKERTDQPHKNLPVASNKHTEDLDSIPESNKLRAVLPVKNNKEKSMDFIIIDEDKNLVPVSDKLESNEFRNDFLAKLHDPDYYDTPIIIELTPHHDTDLPVHIQNPVPDILDASDLPSDFHLVELQHFNEPESEELPKKLIPHHYGQSNFENSVKKPAYKTIVERQPLIQAFNGRVGPTDIIAPSFVPSSDIKGDDNYNYNYKDAAPKTIKNQYSNGPYRRLVPVVHSLSKSTGPLRPEHPHKPSVYSSLNYAGDRFIASDPNGIASSNDNDSNDLEEVLVADNHYWEPYVANDLNRPTYQLPHPDRIGTGGYYIAEERDSPPLLGKSGIPYEGSRIISMNSGEAMNDYWE